MFCTNCGKEISPRAEYCPHCGFHPKKHRNFCANCGVTTTEAQELCLQCGCLLGQSGTARVESSTALQPWVAALLSFFINGLGQIILGQVHKGVAMLFGALIFGGITGGIGIPIYAICVSLDAYLIAKKINEGQAVGRWEFF
ncbi:MAG: zinc-ribbon domain-containing protein [Limnochordia bacterium]|jgi:TM2 domain-containing membrane protein YozV|nr:zinc-ribbon domain-containing protein [Limnochordia bacterium]MDD2630001.1 zinc-ribbon domain-containing protein [Limnochordia bacterium]MDD4517403.1 zinc-ribbon domain-containing protein [Limnochordia bacterium]